MTPRELVLGGNGLIGAALAERLRARGAQVDTLDLKSGCDLRRAPVPSFKSHDRVWFLAWDTGGAKYIESASAQHEIYRNNSELCARVFDELARSRTPFIFTTSQLAGEPTAYGMTKLVAEHWAAQLGGHIARLWNVFGWEEPGVRSHVVTDLVLSGLRDGEIRLRTDGRERRRLLYKTDCVDGLIRTFEARLPSVDIAGPGWVSVAELAALIGDHLGVPVSAGNATGQEVLRDPVSPPPGWTPRVGLADGLESVISEARLFLRASNGPPLQ
jgi:nucleoside-diphosphate-sugar epimerase